MAEYVLAPQAADDLEDIWRYIASDSPEAADRVKQEIYLACEFLARAPMSGRKRPEFTRQPVLVWTIPRYPNYLVVYSPSHRPLLVMRLLHGKRNLRRLLR